jgi:hypothetical protein
MSWDENDFSELQIVLRKQIAFFVARQEDIDHLTPGRRKEIRVGQSQQPLQALRTLFGRRGSGTWYPRDRTKPSISRQTTSYHNVTEGEIYMYLSIKNAKSRGLKKRDMLL